MAKPISDLFEKMPREYQDAADKEAMIALVEILLQEIKDGAELSLQDIADRLGVDLSDIPVGHLSANNVKVNILAQIITALGAKLEISARFPDGEKIDFTKFFERSVAA